MTAQRPINSDDDEHRVIPFRPRSARTATTAGQRPQPAHDAHAATPPPSPQPPPDDFRQRMLANLAAFIFTALLTAIGIWLATTMADLRKGQDCSLLGRHDCERPISKSR